MAFGKSLSDTIDVWGRRGASIKWHVPGMMPMFLAFSLFESMLSRSWGVTGSRPASPVYLTMLHFLFVDLDRPHRGLIEVSQESMHALLIKTSKPG